MIFYGLVGLTQIREIDGVEYFPESSITGEWEKETVNSAKLIMSFVDS